MSTTSPLTTTTTLPMVTSTATSSSTIPTCATGRIVVANRIAHLTIVSQGDAAAHLTSITALTKMVIMLAE